MTPRDLAVLLLVSAVVLFVLAAYMARARRRPYLYIASVLALVGFALFVFPISGAVDTHPAISTDQVSTGERELPRDPTAAKGKDVYYKTEGLVAGPPAPSLTARDYPQIPLPWPFSESRLWMWVLGQQHLYFGAFVLGALFWIMGLELNGLLTRKSDAAQRYDGAAHDILGLVVLAVSGSAISGALLLLAFVSLYPDFAKYLIGVFRPFVWIYGLLFVAFSLAIYLYYYMWQRMAAGFAKWIHATLGVVVNVIGNVIMMIGSSWGTFMMSPAGVDERGQFLGSYINLLHHALWNPFNVHRFASHLIFGAAVIAAYAGYRALKSETDDQRTFYSWTCNAGFLALVFSLFTVPFGGYWLLLEIYAYRREMGITLLGGILVWFNVVIVMLMVVLFFAINYYLWQRIASTPGGERRRRYAKWAFVLLAMCVLVYITPHTSVIKPPNLIIGYPEPHPVVGSYSVESAKQPAVNIMIAVTMWSFLMFWRSRYQLQPSRSKSDVALIALFVAGAANIIWLGLIGRYLPANYRILQSIPMVITTLHIIVIGLLLTRSRVSRAKPLSNADRGNLSGRGYVVVLVMAAAATWLMAIGGYQRSAVRLFWHAMEIFRDASPWAFTHAIGFAGNVIAFNTLLFWSLVLFLIWLRRHG